MGTITGIAAIGAGLAAIGAGIGIVELADQLSNLWQDSQNILV